METSRLFIYFPKFRNLIRLPGHFIHSETEAIIQRKFLVMAMSHGGHVPALPRPVASDKSSRDHEPPSFRTTRHEPDASHLTWDSHGFQLTVWGRYTHVIKKAGSRLVAAVVMLCLFGECNKDQVHTHPLQLGVSQSINLPAAELHCIYATHPFRFLSRLQPLLIYSSIYLLLRGLSASALRSGVSSAWRRCRETERRLRRCCYSRLGVSERSRDQARG